MIVESGSRMIVVKGKKKGEIVTVIKENRYADCYFEVEFDNVYDFKGHKLHKEYHFLSLDHYNG